MPVLPKVLAVDDDVDVLEFLLLQLSLLGHETLSATSLDTALAFLAEGRGDSPGVVITDLNLLGSSCRPLLLECAQRGIPAMVVTASPEEALKLCEEFPGTGLLAKPVVLDDLAAALAGAGVTG